jgi:hypothetical protein
LTESEVVTATEVGTEDTGAKTFTSEKEGLWDAVRALNEKREREAAQGFPEPLVKDVIAGIELAHEPDVPGVTKLTRLDGRPVNQPLTAEEASREITKYRAQRSAEILQAIEPERTAADQAETPTEAETAGSLSVWPSVELISAHRSTPSRAASWINLYAGRQQPSSRVSSLGDWRLSADA